MSSGTFEGAPILTAEVSLPREGVWDATVVTSGEAAATGRVTLTIEGIGFAGTVLRSGSFGGRCETVIVGGAGNLSSELAAKNYTAPSVRTVVEDILRETGEALSATSDASVLASRLPAWEREKRLASRSLSSILAKVSATWRVLPDGSVWVGQLTWPADTKARKTLHENWANGIFTLATDKPDLAPGTTLNGEKISYVVHRLTPTELRTEAWIRSPGSVLERILSGIRQEIDFSRTYACRVVSQHDDGSLELMPDDSRLRGKGLDRVKVHHGFPGTVKVAPGARCDVGFLSGDPAQPYVHGWETSSAIEIALAGGQRPIAAQGEAVVTFLSMQTLTQLCALINCTAPGSPPTPNPSAALMLAATPVQFAGTVVSGSPIAKAP